MTLDYAILLGVVQGLTEFLPVSSSGHLVIIQKILGFIEAPVAFDVLVHTATLLAVVIVFRREILTLNRPFISAILAGTIPTAFIGLILESRSELLFNSPKLAGVALLFTSLILLSTLFIKRTSKESDNNLSTKKAIAIGIVQGIAVIPGISRSAATIVTGLWVGLDQKTAFKFAFLLSIPAIAGAQALQISEITNLGNHNLQAYFAGFIVASVTGVISLKVVKKIVENQKLHLFAIYTTTLALLVLLS